jgi:hypothetical protein
MLLRKLAIKSVSHFELKAAGVDYFQPPARIETHLLNARSLLLSLLERRHVTLILGKSMPRSGHHFLSKCLSHYFGSALHYCESYNASNCCRRTPCCKPYNDDCSNRFFMQKSHDLGFWDTRLLRGKYLIQYRSPIPRLQSHFELGLRTGYIAANTVQAFRDFAEHETTYFINFYRKWLTTPPRDSLVISYEELTEYQLRTLTKVIEFLEGKRTINMDNLFKVIGQLPARHPSALRNPHSCPYLDLELFRGLERKIVEGCGTDRIRLYFLD